MGNRGQIPTKYPITETSVFSPRFDAGHKFLDRVICEQVDSIFGLIAITRPELIQKSHGVDSAKFIDQCIFCTLSYRPGTIYK